MEPETDRMPARFHSAPFPKKKSQFVLLPLPESQHTTVECPHSKTERSNITISTLFIERCFLWASWCVYSRCYRNFLAHTQPEHVLFTYRDWAHIHRSEWKNLRFLIVDWKSLKHYISISWLDGALNILELNYRWRVVALRLCGNNKKSSDILC